MSFTPHPIGSTGGTGNGFQPPLPFWNGRVAVFDLDKTLLAGESLPSFMWEVFRQDRIGFLRRMGIWQALKDFREVGAYTWDYMQGRQISEPAITSFGTRTLRRVLPPDMDLRIGTRDWFEAVGREKLNQVVVGELKALRRQGNRILLASSSLDVLVDPIARFLGIDPEDVIRSETVLTETGKLDKLKTYRQHQLKAEAVERRLLQLEALAERSGVKLDRQGSYLYTDSRSDLAVLKKSGIGNLTAVGTDLDAYLRKIAGRRIRLFDGAAVIERFKIIERERRPVSYLQELEKLIPRRNLTRSQRVTGLWLAPCQWLIGDLASYALYEREFCWPGVKDSLISLGIFAGMGSLGETLTRGIYNLRQRLPFLYAGPNVRGGVFGGSFHMVGSFFGFAAMELFHRPQEFSWKNVLNQTFTQGACWMASRFAILGALKLFKVPVKGNLWVQLAEATLFPAVEFLLMKWMNDWDYRNVC